MSEEASHGQRPVVEALDEVLGVPFKVLDDGFVRVIDYMGADESIVQAARVSYGRGTKKVHEDRGLIRYLMRHWHTTPFEMCDIKLHVRVPMDCWRQWIRHRTACLAEGTEIYFDLPVGDRTELGKIRVEELWTQWQSNAAATRTIAGTGMRRADFRVRHMDEETRRIDTVGVRNVFRNGRKPVFAVVLADGKRIEATRDHRFHFADGWKTLQEECGLSQRDGKASWDERDHELFVNGTLVASQELEIPFARSSLTTVAKLVRIERFEYVGEKETYDLEVEGPFHNFVANGIVTHNSVNEYSTRYSIAIDGAQRASEGEWRSQSAGNRQGSEGYLEVAQGRVLTERERELQQLARDVYQERLEMGVAREQARKDLPLSTYTEAYWKTNLHNLFHFLRLRMDEHAQEEIRDYARVIGEEIVARWCPIAWEAFLDYQFHSSGLTRLEREVVRALTSGNTDAALQAATSYGWLDRGAKGLKVNRERGECEAKLLDFGLAIPWTE